MQHDNTAAATTTTTSTASTRLPSSSRSRSRTGARRATGGSGGSTRRQPGISPAKGKGCSSSSSISNGSEGGQGRRSSSVPPTTITGHGQSTQPSPPLSVRRENMGKPAGILVNGGKQDHHSEASASSTPHAHNTAHASVSTTTNPVLAPLLSLLPKHVHLDPVQIKRLLKGVHPTAFGTYRTKEAWRREHGDVSSIDYSLKRTESCPAGCGRGVDGHDPASAPPSPTLSTSSLADLEENPFPHTQLIDNHDHTASSSTAFLPSNQDAAIPSIRIPSPVSPSSTPPPTFSHSFSFSSPSSSSSTPAMHFLSTRSPSSHPSSAAAVPRLRRSPSSASLASSHCTCSSVASSSTSSVRFAPLPVDELESGRLLSGRPEKSFAMGVKGRVNLLQGRLREDDPPDADLLGDARAGRDGPLIEEGDHEEDEEVANRRRREEEAVFTWNDAGEAVEKRPLGVTLEELVLPTKKHRHYTASSEQTAQHPLSNLPSVTASNSSSSPSQTAPSPASSRQEELQDHEESPRGRSRGTTDLSGSFNHSLPTGFNAPTSPSAFDKQHSRHSSDSSSSSSSSKSRSTDRDAEATHDSDPTPRQTPRLGNISLAFSPLAAPSPVKYAAPSSYASLHDLTPSPTPRSASPAIKCHRDRRAQPEWRDGQYTETIPETDADEMTEDSSESPGLDSSSPASDFEDDEEDQDEKGFVLDELEPDGRGPRSGGKIRAGGLTPPQLSVLMLMQKKGSNKKTAPSLATGGKTAFSSVLGNKAKKNAKLMPGIKVRLPAHHKSSTTSQ